MRKLWMAVTLGLVAALAVAGMASAVNTYVISIGKATPDKPGSPSKPSPAKVDFGYKVGESENLRPSVINQYYIASEGIKYFPQAVPKCTFAQADESPAYNRKCKAAVVGKGTIANAFGASSDRTAKAPCDVKLTLINISNGKGVTKKRGGIAIRIDTGPPDCPLDIHGSLPAPIFDVKLDGIPSSEYRFTVPDSLVHPAPGVDNSVIDVVSHIPKKLHTIKIKGKSRKVSFASSVGRKGKKRTLRVTFISEDGHKSTAIQQFPK
jgi:hypothetical protein